MFTFLGQFSTNVKNLFKIYSYIQKKTPNPINAFKIIIYNTNTPTIHKRISRNVSMFENFEQIKTYLFVYLIIYQNSIN